MAHSFDWKKPSGEKAHMQSFGAMRHFDYRQPGAILYDMPPLTVRDLNMPMTASKSFTGYKAIVTFRTEDDHVKNISFLRTKPASGHSRPRTT